MSSVSLLKETFAIAPLEGREAVVQKLAASHTQESTYYQGLILLQKIYEQVTQHSDPVKPRQPTDIEATLSKQMKDLLSTFKPKNQLYNELSARFHLLIYPFETDTSVNYIKQELHLDTLDLKKPTDKKEDGNANNESSVSSRLDPQLLDDKTLIQDSFERLPRDSPYSYLDLTPLAYPTVMEKNSWAKLAPKDQAALLKLIFTSPSEHAFGPEIMQHLAKLWKYNPTPDKAWDLSDFPFYNLTLNQMDQLAQEIPEVVLLRNSFINGYLQKLVPAEYHDNHAVGPVSFWDDGANMLYTYLLRLEQFIERLPEIYFEAKAAVKFHKLRIDIVRQDFSEERLISYLVASKSDGLTSPVPSRRTSAFGQAQRDNGVDTSVSLPLFGSCTFSESEKRLMMEEYLTGLVSQGKLTKSIETLGGYVDYHSFLKPLYAKIMLTTGSSNQDSTWAEVLGSREYGLLTEKSFVSFAPASVYKSVKRKPSENIQLQVRTKNIGRLSLRVFQIDPENFWRLHLNDRDLAAASNSINLDGLCPTFEKDLDFSDEPSIHVKTTEINFGSEGMAEDVFAGRGLWVVECVGGENQCRAIVQKGYLRHVMQETSAGHLARILDEENRVLDQAKIWFDNQYYEANEDGDILIPYLPQESGGKQNDMILISSADSFCEPDSFYRSQESYSLTASFYVNPEMVHFSKKSTVVVMPKLTLNGNAVPLSLLQDNLILSVDCTNSNGVKTNFIYQNIESNPKYIYYEFMVPEQLTHLEFHLKAKVRATNGKLQDLSASHTVRYNFESSRDVGIPYGIHLKKHKDDEYTLHAFGKNGEVKKGLEISLRFKHAFVDRTIDAVLKTDDEGTIHLGKLENVQWLDHSNSKANYKQWVLCESSKSKLPPSICVSAGESFKLACPTVYPDQMYALYENGRTGSIIKDLSSRVTKDEGFVTIEGLAEGKYTFYFASASGTDQIECNVIESLSDAAYQGLWSNWLVGNRSYGKKNGAMLQKPLMIFDPIVDDSKIELRLQNCSKSAFAIVTTGSFVPSSEETLMKQLFEKRSLARPIFMENDVLSTRSVFLQEKRIGEEYQYILNRARAEKWVGSNLSKPSLLMHPKENVKTGSDLRLLRGERLDAVVGSSANAVYGDADDMGYALHNICAGAMSACAGSFGDSSLAFLDHELPVLIVPVSEDCKISIDRNALGHGGQWLQAVVASGEQTVCQQYVIDSSTATNYKDLRQSANSNKSMIRSKMVSKLLPESTLTLNTHEYQAIDSFEKLWQTSTTLSNVADGFSQQFYFLKTWPTLDINEKSRLFEESVCHELNLWLKKKDPAFFATHVEPALKSKIQKSFMDQYLLEEDLSKYAENYAFNQLSIVEKALLATTQTKEFMENVLTGFKESFDNKVLDSRSDAIFESILAHSALAVPEEQQQSYVESASISSNAQSPPPPSAPSARFGSMFASKLRSASPMAAAFRAQSSTKSSISPQYQPTSPSYSPVTDRVIVHEENEEDQNEAEAEEAANELREQAKKKQKKVAYKFAESTSEWVEKGYQFDSHIPLKQFWIDYVEHHTDTQNNAFLSENFVYCMDSQAELFYMLALMDLPFSAEVDWKLETVGADNSQYRTSLSVVTRSQPLLIFYRTLKENQELDATTSSEHNTLLLGQEIFIVDSSAPVNSEECIKLNPSSESMETLVEYGSHLVLSNASPKSVTCQVTVQIPTGSVPTQSTFYCKSTTICIKPYSTWHDVVATFYFPEAGDFAIVPVTVSATPGDDLLATLSAVNIHVVDRSSKPIETLDGNNTTATSSSAQSWSAVASSATNDNVISFLQSYRKLNKLDLALIGWRMSDASFARSVLDTLKHRYYFSVDMYQYGVYHQFDDVIRDLLQFQSHQLLDRVGQAFESPLICKNSKVKQSDFAVYDYYPLLNARAHPLNKSSSEILNRQFYSQYDKFLGYLSLKSTPPDTTDLVILTVYLLLQDRVGEAQLTFSRISSVDSSFQCQVQLDYLGAYLKTRVPVSSSQQEMQLLDLQLVKDVAKKYENINVPRWRELFQDLHQFVCEVEDGMVKTASENGARNQPVSILEFDIDSRSNELVIQYTNIKDIEIKYYDMEIEVMFSNNPFMNSAVEQNFNWVKPSYSTTVDLTQQSVKETQNIDDDEDFEIIGAGQVSSLKTVTVPFEVQKNVLVEISSGSIKKRQAYYPNHLNAHISESFGVIRVMSEKSKRPLAGVYIKVYARMKQGKDIHFWKDGYTGLNGVFDYIGVTSGNALMGDNTKLKEVMMDKIDKLSILVLSAEEGAIVKEAYPPLTSM